ncbi:hypothetical protein WAF17_20135 [Bernardetia sp. ABR2-2B]|uniref:hypothetical protein n=1 Tax=Bernardetia sp. ABR2-2B TaxID=3127472 RepID=UPI0030D114C3
MKTITYKNFTLEVDFNRTKEVYDNIQFSNLPSCNCSGCRNFLANKESIFHKEFINLLNQLGIDDYKKYSEIYHIYRLEIGKHLYGGWFHFKGRILENGHELKETEPIEINEGFKFFFRKDASLSFFDKEEYSELVQLEILAHSDWVLEKEIELD